MPYAPVAGRGEEDRGESSLLPVVRIASDHQHLANAIGECQRRLADLLNQLEAGADAETETAPARQAIEETIRQLEDGGAAQGISANDGAQLTEFEERVWRRVLEAMRADVRRVEVALLERTDAVRAEQTLAA